MPRGESNAPAPSVLCSPSRNGAPARQTPGASATPYSQLRPGSAAPRPAGADHYLFADSPHSLGEHQGSLLIGSLGSAVGTTLHPAQIEAATMLVQSEGTATPAPALLARSQLSYSAVDRITPHPPPVAARCDPVTLLRQDVVATVCSAPSSPELAAQSGTLGASTNSFGHTGRESAATGGGARSRRGSRGGSTDAVAVAMDRFLDNIKAGPSARFGHVACTVVTRAGRRLFVHGGRNDDAYLSDAWLYDPRTGAWSEIKRPPPSTFQPWPSGRSAHTATALPNGKVLVYGGAISHEHTTTETWEFDVAAGTWELVDEGEPCTLQRVGDTRPSPHASAVAPVAALAADAQFQVHVHPEATEEPVAVPVATPSLVRAQDDPAGGVWRPMNRKGHTCVAMRGSVYMYGGATQDCIPDPNVWRWDVESREWHVCFSANHPPRARRFHIAEAIDERRFVIASGQAVREVPPGVAATSVTVGAECLADVWIFDTLTHLWTAVATTGDVPRPRMCATSLLRGHVLALFDGADLEAVLVDSRHQLDLVTGRWSKVPAAAVPQPHPTNRGTSTLVGNSVVLVGGHTGTDFSRGVTQVRVAPPTLRRLAARWLLTYHPGLLDVVGSCATSEEDRSSDPSENANFVAT